MAKVVEITVWRLGLRIPGLRPGAWVWRFGVGGVVLEQQAPSGLGKGDAVMKGEASNVNYSDTTELDSIDLF